MPCKGTLGEAKALAYFVKEGYEVFVGFDGKTPFDLIVWSEEHGLQSVSVKETGRKASSGAWVVRVGGVRSNRTTSRHVPMRDDIDLLAVYVKPLDKMFVFDADEVSPEFEWRFYVEQALSDHGRAGAL